MKAETKYNIGQTLWTVGGDLKITEFEVSDLAVFASETGIRVCYYGPDGSPHYEERCFPTKEALMARLGI